MTAKHARRTSLCRKTLERIGLAPTGRAGSRLAARLGLPAGRTTLLGLVHALPDPEVGTVTALGVDDFATRRSRKYATVRRDSGNPTRMTKSTIRAVLDDGPRAGEVVALHPLPDGGAPRQVVVSDPLGPGGRPDDSLDIEHAPAASTTYCLHGQTGRDNPYLYRVPTTADRAPGNLLMLRPRPLGRTENHQMSHPQQHFRAFLEDGPYAGETMSIAPNAEGEPPSRIVVEGDGGGDPREVSDHTTSTGETPPGPAEYQFDHADLDNAVWRYRLINGC